MNRISLFIFIAAVAFSSCSDSPKNSEQTPKDEKAEFVPAEPNTVMVADSVEITESPNKFDLKVKVIANEYTKKGTYTIAVIYGPDSNASMFTMPKGAAHLLPEMKRGGGYNFIIGFTYMGKFYEYYEVKFTYGNPHTTKLSLIKAYVLE